MKGERRSMYENLRRSHELHAYKRKHTGAVTSNFLFLMGSDIFALVVVGKMFEYVVWFEVVVVLLKISFNLFNQNILMV